MKNQFTHLSVSSGYSFKYGTSHPQDLVAKAAELGMSRLALTDNENMASEAYRILNAEFNKRFNDQLKIKQIRMYETPNSWADAI